MSAPYILALDQGTTSSRALLFDSEMRVAAVAQEEFPQHFPKPGWVEHDPDDIWSTTAATAREAIERAGISGHDLAAIGIANQRETTLIWDRKTGRPIHRALVWQDRRTAEMCERLKREGAEDWVQARTGLLLDPYFSATKIAWLLDHTEGARAKAEAGELLFGTVDSWLIWRLTGGRVHATDATNASRTLLFDIRRQCWDPDLLDLFGVPEAMLPDVRDSAGDFGHTRADLFGRGIPIRGVAGDQQAAMAGQACFAPGMLKSTYGTGCFALLNTGEAPVASKNRLLTTVAYRLDGVPHYALEGAIFVAGAAVQWLRDGLGILQKAADSEALAQDADPDSGVYLVPAFTGLGAPHWDSDARGALHGLTRGTGRADIVRAALESVAFQTRDLLEAMRRDAAGTADVVLRVDGGMTENDWLMQCLADMLGAPVDRPRITETTALGAAWLAGMAVGVYPGREEFSKSWARDRRFIPALDEATRAARYAGWQDALRRTLSGGG
jgi:glycerol kinase